MTNRTWIGGGNNEASNPNDWSPAGVPGANDQVLLDQGTIKISGNEMSFPFNPATGWLDVTGDVNLVLSQNAVVNPIILTGAASKATIKVHGETQFPLQTNAGSATVDLASNSKWVGYFSDFGGTITINGKEHATFIMSTASGGTGTTAEIVMNADVGAGAPIGVNSGASIEFEKSVAAGQSVESDTYPDNYLPGIVKIDDLGDFHGTAKISDGRIDLNGLAKADSYSYKNDLLTLYQSNGKAIGSLTLDMVAPPTGAPSGSGSFDVSRTAAGVSIFSTNSLDQPSGTLLHQIA